MPMAELAQTKAIFQKNARKVLKQSGADHVVYCHIIYDEEGMVESARFYNALTMDDATFYERTSEISGNDYVGAVHKL
jgi:hypothetical protein